MTGVQTCALPIYDKLTPYLWNIVKEIIKTAIENKQNLIVEGCYIPADYKDYFTADYLSQIEYICLIFSEKYIKNNYLDIVKYANVIENRLQDDCVINQMIDENNNALKIAKALKNDYILIDDVYNLDFKLQE